LGHLGLIRDTVTLLYFTFTFVLSLYINSFILSSSFLSASIVTSISVHVFLVLFLIIISGLVAVNYYYYYYVVVVVVVVVVSCYRLFLPGTSPESIESFPGVASKFLLKPSVTVPMTPVITGTLLHFMFHLRCILYLFSYLLPFTRRSCPLLLSHLSVRIHYYYYYYYYYLYYYYKIYIT